jgi:hypothetical protein
MLVHLQKGDIRAAFVEVTIAIIYILTLQFPCEIVVFLDQTLPPVLCLSSPSPVLAVKGVP